MIAAASAGTAAVFWVLGIAVRAYHHREVPIDSDSGMSVSAAMWRGRWAFLAGLVGFCAVGAFVHQGLVGMAIGAVMALLACVVVLVAMALLAVPAAPGRQSPASGVTLALIVTFVAAPHLPTWLTVGLIVGIIILWPSAWARLKRRFQGKRV